MTNNRSGTRVGVYVDIANINRNGGYGMRYDILRDYASRDGADPMRLNTYVGYDADRAEHDTVYRDGQIGFYSLLRDFGYKVIEKNIRWYVDEMGRSFGKANADLDLADRKSVV